MKCNVKANLTTCWSLQPFETVEGHTNQTTALFGESNNEPHLSFPVQC